MQFVYTCVCLLVIISIPVSVYREGPIFTPGIVVKIHSRMKYGISYEIFNPTVSTSLLMTT